MAIRSKVGGWVRHKTKFSPASMTVVEKIPGVRSFVLASLAVLLLGALLTFFLWRNERHQVALDSNKRFTEQVDVLNNAVSGRLRVYEEMLRGGAGLFAASEHVTRDEWRLFVSQYNIERRYPGLLALGYAPYIMCDQVNSLVQQVRGEGYDTFTVRHAESGREQHCTPVLYIEPFNEQNQRAFGYDMYSEPIRREAMKRAYERSTTAISGKVVLIQDQDSGRAGFLMYLPISQSYNNNGDVEAPQNLRGYVYGAFRADDFFSQTLLPTNLLNYLDIQIYNGDDVSDETIMYQSANFLSNTSEASAPLNTIVAGQRWTYMFKVVSNHGVESEFSNAKPTLILVGGLTGSMSLAVFLFMIMHIRSRSLVYAKQRETQQAKDDLLALASHQLRTPATVVKQYLGMVLQGYFGKVNSQQIPSLQRAYANNERQIEIINQILYVAKADAGQLKVHKDKMNINTVIEEVIADLGDELEDKKQKITFHKLTRRKYIQSDEHCIRMVLENLITNASKYSPEGTRIEVRLKLSGEGIKISVADEGVGIDSKDFDKLFVKFSRIENDFSVQEGGSGIGLYLDKVLIELLGGRIEVESAVGKGSTFYVTLPSK